MNIDFLNRGILNTNYIVVSIHYISITFAIKHKNIFNYDISIHSFLQWLDNYTFKRTFLNTLQKATLLHYYEKHLSFSTTIYGYIEHHTLCLLLFKFLQAIQRWRNYKNNFTINGIYALHSYIRFKVRIFYFPTKFLGQSTPYLIVSFRLFICLCRVKECTVTSPVLSLLLELPTVMHDVVYFFAISTHVLLVSGVGSHILQRWTECNPTVFQK